MARLLRLPAAVGEGFRANASTLYRFIASTFPKS
jgi:hypothetical protein